MFTRTPLHAKQAITAEGPQRTSHSVSKHRIPFVIAVLALALAGTATWSATSTSTVAAAPAAFAPVHEHHTTHDNDIVFGPAPDALPPGAEMAVLQGDPSAPGQLFTIRLRLPSGYVLPPHQHPTDENLTVIKGTFLVGLGDVFDRNATQPLHRGDFISAPANANHFAQARGRTVVQVHAIGPFAIVYANPQDDPRNH